MGSFGLWSETLPGVCMCVRACACVCVCVCVCVMLPGMGLIVCDGTFFLAEHAGTRDTKDA